MYEEISNEVLLETYYKTVDLGLNQLFIDLLKEALASRGIKL